MSEPPSKTQMKRAMHELQALGAELVTLNADRLHSLALPEALHEAVETARHITAHEGRRRQLQYIGRLMRDIDATPIREKLAEWRGQSAAATREMHRVERWRDRLLADDQALTEFAREFPIDDHQAFRACLREARKEHGAIAAARAAGPSAPIRPPRQLRELYRLIRRAIEASSADHAPEK